jgi:hypothetical protein
VRFPLDFQFSFLGEKHGKPDVIWILGVTQIYMPIFGKDFPWQKQFGSELEIFLVSMES